MLSNNHEVLMLQGNINRMCVTDDLTELKEMRNWALSRINTIYFEREAEIRKNSSSKINE